MSAAVEAEPPLVKIPHPYSKAEMRACDAPKVLELRRRFRTCDARLTVHDDPEVSEPVVVALFFNIDPPPWASTAALRAKWATKLVRATVESTLLLQMRPGRVVRGAWAMRGLAALEAVIAADQLLVGSHPRGLPHRLGPGRHVVVRVALNSGTPRPELVAAREASREKANRLRAEGFTW